MMALIIGKRILITGGEEIKQTGNAAFEKSYSTHIWVKL